MRKKSLSEKKKRSLQLLLLRPLLKKNPNLQNLLLKLLNRSPLQKNLQHRLNQIS
jgi:hypothetical protein